MYIVNIYAWAKLLRNILYKWTRLRAGNVFKPCSHTRRLHHRRHILPHPPLGSARRDTATKISADVISRRGVYVGHPTLLVDVGDADDAAIVRSITLLPKTSRLCFRAEPRLRLDWRRVPHDNGST